MNYLYNEPKTTANKKAFVKQSITVMAVAVFLTISGGVHATSVDGASVAKEGRVICSGNFQFANPSSHWIIHNINETASITLKRMRIYSAGGTSVYDSLTNGPAPSATVVPFGAIGPYQTLSFKSNDLINAGLLPGNLPSNEVPVKVIFDWISTNNSRVLTPYILLTRKTTSSIGESRHARDCRSVK